MIHSHSFVPAVREPRPEPRRVPAPRSGPEAASPPGRFVRLVLKVAIFTPVIIAAVALRYAVVTW